MLWYVRTINVRNFPINFYWCNVVALNLERKVSAWRACIENVEKSKEKPSMQTRSNTKRLLLQDLLINSSIKYFLK
jgi:hypothetical protein